jgi:hypothetical protein
VRAAPAVEPATRAPIAERPLIAVLVPLEDSRGDVATHLRSWTHEQTLARERFQVIVASADADPAGERAVADLLAPGDALVRTPGVGVVDLWNAAAARAEASWLVFTEAHCLGDPKCLEALAYAVESDPALDAASLHHGHSAPTRSGDLCARWFGEVYEQWDRDTWRHLNFVGVAVRREVFEAVGRLAPDLGLFCAPMFSARLHEHGARVGHVDSATVVHVHNDSLPEHHAFSADYTRGELSVRATHAQAFCERYFGHDWIWTNRLAYRPEIARRLVRDLADALARAAVRRRHDVPWLAWELARAIPAAGAGARPHAALEHARFAVDEWLAERAPLTVAARYARFLSAQRRVVRRTRLRWVRDHVGAADAPVTRTGTWDVDELGDSGLVGAHALERDEGLTYRWTEPVTLLRVAAPEGPHELVLDTGGLRGAPSSYVVATYVDGRHIRRDRLSDDGRRLVVPLVAARSTPGRAGGVTILSRPLDGRALPTADPRRLGLPLFSVELRPRS